MTCLTRIVLSSSLSEAGFKSVVDLAPGKFEAVNNLQKFLGGMLGGSYDGSLSVVVGSAKAAATLTSTGSATNNQTCTICNVTFTAKSSGATGNQFNVSGTVATQAANIAAAVNASADLAGLVVATSALGVVTLTAVVPGLAGNGLQLSVGTLSNVTASAFASGMDGTSYSFAMGA